MEDTHQVKQTSGLLRAKRPQNARLHRALRTVAALACICVVASNASAAPVASKSKLPVPASRFGAAKNATTPAKTGAPKLAGVVVTGAYVLGPSDQVSVTSLSHPEVSAAGLLVPVDGKLNLPLIGAFSVSGKTISQLEKEVQAGMKRQGFLRPLVTITLQVARAQQVFVLGASGAGVVDIRPGFRVSDALVLAGGLGETRPELTDATLSRVSSTKPIVLDLPSILRNGNSNANILLQNGDTIRLIPRTIQINVAGRVSKSGPLEIPIGSTLTEVIALAGGVLEKSALSRSTLKRAAGGAIIPINFYDILVKGKPAPKIQLQEGDLLLIPEAQEQVTIQGAVNNSGYFSIPDGKTLRISELVALAGGTTAMASLTRTSVQHADGTTQLVNLYNVLALNQTKDNIELQPEDIVTIPAYVEQVVVAGTGVKAVGFYAIEEGKEMRILDALTKAGGLASEPESTQITITRGMPGAIPSADPKLLSASPQALMVNATKLYKLNDINENIVVKNGDLIMVTSTPRFVYLAGEVKTPGAMVLEPGEGLVELLARAGGITEKGLASGVVVERDGAKNTVDVFAALAKGDSLNYPIFPGDNIVVPISMNRVLVMAGVEKPGYVNIPEDRPLTLTEAIMLAGGTSRDTKLNETVLLRQTENGLTQTKTPLKTPQQLVNASKIILQSGDIVFVPQLENKKPNILSRFMNILPFANIFGLRY